jgi:hypothetical protein
VYSRNVIDRNLLLHGGFSVVLGCQQTVGRVELVLVELESGQLRREICLKRYIAREVFHAIQRPPTSAKNRWRNIGDLVTKPYHSTPVETQNSFCSGSDILTHRVPAKLCTPSSMRRAPSACNR